jgi:hypothetical protein
MLRQKRPAGAGPSRVAHPKRPRDKFQARSAPGQQALQVGERDGDRGPGHAEHSVFRFAHAVGGVNEAAARFRIDDPYAGDSERKIILNAFLHFLHAVFAREDFDAERGGSRTMGVPEAGAATTVMSGTRKRFGLTWTRCSATAIPHFFSRLWK